MLVPEKRPTRKRRSLVGGRAAKLLQSILIALISLAGLAASLAQNPESTGYLYTTEKEQALGKHLAQEVEERSALVEDALVLDYVNRVGQSLARHADARVPLSIQVIDSQAADAIVLPGGFLFLKTGLILRAEKESELAAFMAHQIAHIAARHGMRKASPGRTANFATVPVIFLGGWNGICTLGADGLQSPVSFRSAMRAGESEADALGLQYVSNAGYEPNAFIEIFDKLERDEQWTGWPELKDARAKLAGQLEVRPNSLVNTPEFDAAKQRLEATSIRTREIPPPSLK